MTHELHSEGYHGTSLPIARAIEVEGFTQMEYGFICFAALNDINFARLHGHRRAVQEDANQFGIVKANFPEQNLLPSFGGYQIDVPANEAQLIKVTAVLVFDTLSELELKTLSKQYSPSSRPLRTRR